MDAKATDPNIILGDRRDELDALDAQLLDILRRRIECCASIAHLKREHDIPMMQPGRVGVVHQRAEAFAKEHGINAEFLRSLYEVIITETCRVESLIIDEAPAPQRQRGVEVAHR
ncbi:chorismate mutase family protein [Micrococcus luteus]|uniref:chorismate mutase family protein n=1 Tax=Micrococcus luteus TaxID=1270 RepID=UPI00190FF7DA|nr:chorismate mutase family protein [Micrococcus luteus]QQE48168.1 chorismate mutase family protein [Micrococcus luteus]